MRLQDPEMAIRRASQVEIRLDRRLVPPLSPKAIGAADCILISWSSDCVHAIQAVNDDDKLDRFLRPRIRAGLSGTPTQSFKSIASHGSCLPGEL
jgi:hypothetical protein